MGWSRSSGVVGMAVAVTLAGCGTASSPTVDPVASSAQDTAGPTEVERESVPDEAGSWELTGSSPDGLVLTLATPGGGCSSFQGWASEETATQVRVEARWEHSGAEICNAILLVDQIALRLDEPLGDRQLTGCGRDDCLLPPDDSHGPFGRVNDVSVDDDVVVVTGPDTVWSIAPSDGMIRWERPSAGYWSLGVDGMVLRYDHFDHIESLDATTGEILWGAVDVTLAGIDGDQVIVCPREQALDDGPRESFRGALSLHDGAWLWRNENVPCTTGSIDRQEPDVPDVELDPAVIGHSSEVEFAVHDGVVYVATSTALIALDRETSERLWWTPLTPPTAVTAGGIHPPTSG